MGDNVASGLSLPLGGGGRSPPQAGQHRDLREPEERHRRWGEDRGAHSSPVLEETPTREGRRWGEGEGRRK